MRLLLLALLVLITNPGPGYAVNPNEVLEDPVLETRAREISKGLRCLVCQNQSIDDSDASLAQDLRVLVRERLLAGDSDDQVITYVVSRYGEFVLLKPPLTLATLALWIGPFVLILFGLLAIVIYFRRNARSTDALSTAAPLTEDEQKRLDKLLAENDL